ncbi:glycine zipper 2TM domain-containing protein [Chitinibacter tainanensis]|uniref:glycine zipper 2TM domain-containing protein n=1 Tax=Chitinibacter tainanensis TaxID=230667 RepID=UPI0003F7771B|nr:glycine zipper 2TM domain-containing protein [Chitinibacter tainanensis]
MRTTTLLGASLLALMTTTAMASDGWHSERTNNSTPRWQQRDYAIVRSVEPQYESVRQERQECRSEWITEQVPRNTLDNSAGTILGGVAGGVIGHQIGKGRGKDVATVAGTLIGAMLGDHVASQYNPSPRYDTVSREVQRCRPVSDTTQRIRDYRVSYEYRSQIYTTNLAYDPGRPGSRIPVRVLVELEQ